MFRMLMRETVACSVILPVLYAVGLTLVVNAPAAAQFGPYDSTLNYEQTRDENPITDLFEKVRAGEVQLEYDPHYGYLRSLLDELKIPVSSQSLVYSKTSLQAGRISPQNPRAIYFNDDVYIGWVQGSALLEISTTDPRLGAAFYTMRMRPERVHFQRENNRCLACHYIPMTQGVPGHAIRSVLTKETGRINSLERSFVTDHTSRFADRWGGWYVTGNVGAMQHMGNAFLEGEELVPFGENNRANLEADFDTSRWLSPHSDIVALMVMEHQTQMQNTFTRANLDVRRAALEAATEENADSNIDQVIQQAAEQIVSYLLFSGEAPIEAEIKGSSTYVADFGRMGSRTKDGRSLRDFDLKTRLFRYPCSYLIDSAAFESLEPPLKAQVYKQLWDVLTNPAADDDYAHIDAPSRTAILSILSETKADLPSYWHKS
ncbi:hypothetical protein [Roseimaritima multifibrata]|nr:hypothetical protein [Roseimaritima multifibrata]